MTSRPRTLSWMPHCCPQKQQWVLTSLSAGCRDSSRQPPGGTKFRCGPYRSISASTGMGGLAMCVLLQTQLRGCDRLALARGAELLPMAGRPRDRVVKIQLRENNLQVLNVHARREPLSAPRAECGLVPITGGMVGL